MAIHRRREFIFTLGGAVAAWPLAVRAQQREHVRRIGVFMPGVADDPGNAVRNAAFLQGLGELGWIVGRNVRIDYRWGAGDAERYHLIAAELIALSPDVVLAYGSLIVGALQKATRSVWWYSGHEGRTTSANYDANDPTETWAAQDFRSAKACSFTIVTKS